MMEDETEAMGVSHLKTKSSPYGDDYRPVEIDTLESIFITVGILYVISILMFLVELICNKINELNVKKRGMNN